MVQNALHLNWFLVFLPPPPHISCLSHLFFSFFPQRWGLSRTSKRGLVASGQWAYLAPVWRKNWFWLGWGQSSKPRGLDAAGTRREPIRKAIDQFPLISQLVSTSPLQSKTPQLSQTDRGLDSFQRLQPPPKWIDVRVCPQHRKALCSVLSIPFLRLQSRLQK